MTLAVREMVEAFRGITAAASLKRAVLRGGCAQPSAFRGITAAASLKHIRPALWVGEWETRSAASLPRPH